jgi:hypothetical protein
MPEPAAAHEVAERDEVAAVGGDHLPVAAAKGHVRPPAVLDQPRLADGLDGAAVDRLRPAVGGGAHPDTLGLGEAAGSAGTRRGGTGSPLLGAA